MITRIDEWITGEMKRIAIVGHVRPDGDCVGSVMGLYGYLKASYPEIEVIPYLEEPVYGLQFLLSGKVYRTDDGAGEQYDLVISCDASDAYRIGAGAKAFSECPHTACVDHHGTNTGFADENHIEGEASSCSEVLFYLMNSEKVDHDTAEALYTGILHDTGAFRYSCVHPSTMRCAAALLEHDIDFPRIIRDSMTDCDYRELRMNGAASDRSIYYEDAKTVVSLAPLSMQEEYNVYAKDLGAIVSELNRVRGSEAALFLYEITEGKWKGSLRSRDLVNVAEIAGVFGGGGHEKAAGFSTENPEETIKQVLQMIKEQLPG